MYSELHLEAVAKPASNAAIKNHQVSQSHLLESICLTIAYRKPEQNKRATGSSRQKNSEVITRVSLIVIIA